ncbi:hypothetical protein FB446DRAFT_440594 [Lentinula raphanica]|nr:hypothetical protein FB446DRAFT_440594 [Lentinula raphanica]
MTLFRFSNLAALLIFSSFSVLAFHFILGHGDSSGLFNKLSAQCKPELDEAPYLLSYTGIKSIDDTLCGIVVMFHASFGPDVAPFLTYFLVSAIPITGFAYFESSRPHRPLLMAYPVLFFQIMQLISFGVTFSIYWALFILSGASRLSPSWNTRVTQAHAQAALFGIFIGLVVLTGCMMTLQDPYITAIWQVFPIVASVATLAHLLVRPSSGYRDGSGFGIIRGFYIAAFILTSSMHISFIASKDTQELKAFMLPSLHVLPPSTSLELQSLNLLQWDAVFGLLSALVGTLWFGKNAKEVFALIAWNLFASPLVGPGAAFAASALWRESWLHSNLVHEKLE